MVSLGIIELDTWDFVIFVVLCMAGLYYFFTTFFKKSDSDQYRSFAAVTPVANHVSNGSVDSAGGWIERMKNSGRSLAIFYGSQTGTGEELAGRLAKDAKRYGIKAIVLDPEECEMEDLPKLAEIDNSFAIFCMATYGEGDPTDNAQQFFEFLKESGTDMSGLNYAVFGLGNKTYEHYNEMGIFVDKKLEELGGRRLYQLGLGDDDGSLEEDFMKWRESFWPAVCEAFNLVASSEDENARNYRLELLEPDAVKPEQLYVGEMGRLGSYKRQRAPFDPKNPFLAKVVTNRELHTEKSERSCKHIEFDINGSRLRYETGDHAGIFPTNDPELVQRFVDLLDIDVGQPFKLINLDEDSSKKHPFPCPTTYGTALTHYVDIVAPVKSHVLRELINHTDDESIKEKFKLMTTSSEEGIAAYRKYITNGRRSIIDVLADHPSVKPPIDLLLEMLPRLQARYYSISSSPRADANIVSITSVVVAYAIDDRSIKGVCTNYLKDRPVTSGEDFVSQVPMFIRKSTLRLPHRSNIPVIMIGPGTGFAPFRGFCQDRSALKAEGKEVGKMVLYFGCRRSDEDFIYQHEIEHWQAEGTLSEVNLAFSRENKEKCYVQHLLYKNAESTWRLIDQESAHIYLCGDARNMATDVLATFQRIAREQGNLSEKQAQDYFKKLEQNKRYQADVWS